MPAGSQKHDTNMDKLRYALIALAFEKIVQHYVVTLAFYFDVANIRDTVVIHYEILMISGLVVANLFVLSFWGLLKNRQWAVSLITALAVFDIVGEFVAQGKVFITLTVSFIVALVLLVLSRRYRQLA